MIKSMILKKVVFISLMVLGFSLLFSKNIGPVSGVLKPNMMEVAGDELYIVEGAVISVGSAFFTPVGKNFVAKKVKRDPEQKTTFIIIALFD